MPYQYDPRVLPPDWVIAEYVRPGFPVPGPVWPGWPRRPWQALNPPVPIERSEQPPWLPVDML